MYTVRTTMSAVDDKFLLFFVESTASLRVSLAFAQKLCLFLFPQYTRTQVKGSCHAMQKYLSLHL